MGYAIDPEFAAAAAPLLAAIAEAPRLPVGDWLGRRAAVEALMARFATMRPETTDVDVAIHATESVDGSSIELRWYAKQGAAPGAAVLYVHGGGMILGTLDLYDTVVKRYVAESETPMLAVGYRRAPEHPHPTPVEDCYAGLVWLAEHAAALGVDPARLAVMGDSAGGGLAAGVALLARDRGGPALARQVLVYPMLDDRTMPNPDLDPWVTWTYDDNATGWGALLGGAVGGPDVSPYAAPARAGDLSGLPSTYLEVGELDAFRDEDIDYGRRLAAAAVSVELHVHPGVPHAHEAIAPDTDVARRATADRLRVLSSL